MENLNIQTYSNSLPYIDALHTAIISSQFQVLDLTVEQSSPFIALIASYHGPYQIYTNNPSFL